MAQKFSTLFSTNESLSGFTFNNEAMAVAMKKAQEAKTVRAAEQSAALLGELDKHNNSLLASLRAVRKQERLAKEQLEKFKRAGQYFLDTGNFGPLYPFMRHQVGSICCTLGVDLPTAEEQVIPENYSVE